LNIIKLEILDPQKYHLADKKDLCIVMCIERGILEKYGILLARSIRAFGGDFRNIPIYAYVPRKQFSISKSTKNELLTLGVQIIDENLNVEHFYYSLLNKALACAHAETTFEHDYILYLDADTILLEFPQIVASRNPPDISLLPVYFKGIGISQPNDREYPFWQAVYSLLNIPLDWHNLITTSLTNQKIIPYWSGAVIWGNAKLRFFSSWRDNLILCLEKRLHPSSSIYFLEETVLSATVMAMNLQFEPLPYQCNVPVVKELKEQQKIVKHSQIIHHLNEIRMLKEYITTLGLIELEQYQSLWLIDQFKELKLCPRDVKTILTNKLHVYRKNILERSDYLFKKHTNHFSSLKRDT
jgi:hypothetical protein